MEELQEMHVHQKTQQAIQIPRIKNLIATVQNLEEEKRLLLITMETRLIITDIENEEMRKTIEVLRTTNN